jgi:regulator of replication initiation timing
MANIGQDTNAMPAGGKEVSRLFNAVHDDLTEIRAELNKLITDVTATRAEVVKLVTDIATHRTEANRIRTGLINMTLTDAAIAIGTTKTKIKTVTNPISYIIGGTFYSKAATDDFWVLTGFDCANAMFNKCLLCIDSSGNMQIAAGTEAASAGAVVLPAIPASYAVVGMVQVNPTGTGDFTGGTTELDDGTVVPNATYTDLAFHPDTFAALAAGTAGNPAALTATAAAALTLTE